MATRSNRAATAVNKQGGKKGRRNLAAGSYDNRLSLDSGRNQRVFRRAREETVARRHNASTGTEPRGFQDRGFGPGRRGPLEGKPSSQGKRGRRVVAKAPPQPAPRRRGIPSGRGISGEQVFAVGARVSRSGKLTTARSKPTRKGWDRGRNDL